MALTAEEWVDSLIDSRRLALYAAEFEDVERAVLARYTQVDLTHPLEFATERLTSFGLYALIRHLAPGVVMETGVANGHSTAILLAAVLRNGHGMVHSTDIHEGVGRLISPAEREAWSFHCLPPADRSAFVRVLDAIGRIDFFFHDSDHRYDWQRFELDSARVHIPANGIIGSDDVEASFAFLDTCAMYNWNPRFLFDARKVAGFAQV